MFEFKMPSMGADMENGVLVQWNFAVGDRVEDGDIICEIETAKGNIDVEIWEGGVIAELLVEPGAKIPVGDVMARIDTGGAPAVEPAAAEPPAPPAKSEPEPEPAPPQPSRSEQPTVALSAARPVPAADGHSASPAARRRAAELGIDIDTVIGSGPGGVVKLEDVEHAAEQPHHRRVTPVARKMAVAAGINPDGIEASGAHDTVTKADVERALGVTSRSATPAPAADGGENALRDAIARAMAKSKREIPHYYLKSTFDVSEAMRWMEARNAEHGVAERLVFGALIAKAVALAAHDVPEVNGFYENGFRASEAVHLGFAVAMRGGGVVAPALHDLASKSLDEAMAAIKDVVRRVRGGKLRSSEMTDPTITLTSLGDQGVDTVFGVIYPPQVAIVGFGSPREIPFARDAMIGVHTCADVTLSGDHRVSDGLTGARFLQRIEHYLSHPEEL